MPKFLLFMNESITKKNYSIRIDPSITNRQLLLNKLNELDNELEVDNKLSSSLVWVKTSISKERIESLLGVNYVMES